MDSGRWTRMFFTGPNQDGKTLKAFVIPTLYTLFERCETVILGVPTLDIVEDKWSVNLRPTIQKSRYKSLMPRKGKGSKDGLSISYRFRNGAVLRFMTSGGDDQARAAFTSQNLIVTEVDGFDEVGAKSREGDKFYQLEKRTLAFPNPRIIGECTVTTEEGRTWQEYSSGTASRIALRCPHCSEWVTPEREHLQGWQDAKSEFEAARNARIACPSCGVLWSNEERIAANHDPRLVHKGQKVLADGSIEGPVPETDTLGFRWTVVNSILNPERLGKVAQQEWKAKRAVDEETAEKNLRQSQWTLPVISQKRDVTKLDAMVLVSRKLADHGKGIVPDDATVLTVGIDIGRRLCHWSALAWRPGATPHNVEYGAIETQYDQIHDEERAITQALREFYDERLTKGWISKSGKPVPVSLCLVDARYLPDVIIAAVADWIVTMPAEGFGATQRRTEKRLRETGAVVLRKGSGWSAIRNDSGVEFIEINADYWKSWLHRRLFTKLGLPGAYTFFDGGDHFSIAKHLTAEKKIEEFQPGVGNVERWIQVRDANHELDANMLASVAADILGVRDDDEDLPAASEQPASTQTQKVKNFATSYKGRY